MSRNRSSNNEIRSTTGDSHGPVIRTSDLFWVHRPLISIGRYPLLATSAMVSQDSGYLKDSAMELMRTGRRDAAHVKLYDIRHEAKYSLWQQNMIKFDPINCSSACVCVGGIMWMSHCCAAGNIVFNLSLNLFSLWGHKILVLRIE